MPGEKGTLFNIQRFSTEDGPGIRTTLFFKGCPLSCPWCHNPEGMRPQPELAWTAATCIGCGDCRAACPNSAIDLTDGQVHINRTVCETCYECVAACPTNSLQRIGNDYSPEELLAEVLRDRAFYESSGGGVTLSGGEPLMHLTFANQFLRLCRAEKLHVALDTCGVTRLEWFGPLLNWVDLVLFDLKVMDPTRHRELVGGPVDLVLANLERVAKKGIPVWVRTPVIPGHTDDEDNIIAIARHVRDHVPTLDRFELLAFSNMCASKYDMLDREFALGGVPLLETDDMERLAEIVRREGIESVRWSGPTRESNKGATG
ncbi:MAG TPA: glycyl-radical enzyme activating protein [Myxococcota bacterium]|nr:glycyl-radical enzyme activating protein [Myxococcota bacterium]